MTTNKKIIYSILAIVIVLIIGVILDQKVITKQQNNLSECEKASGKLSKIKECDGSENDYCQLTGKIHCYADLVKNGQCTGVEFSEKRYNETGDGMIGPESGPRVLCDR